MGRQRETDLQGETEGNRPTRGGKGKTTDKGRHREQDRQGETTGRRPTRGDTGRQGERATQRGIEKPPSSHNPFQRSEYAQFSRNIRFSPHGEGRGAALRD